MQSAAFRIIGHTGILLPLLLMHLAGCTAFPTAEEFQKSAGAFPPELKDAPPALIDARPQFRQIFCRIATESGIASQGDPGCESFLWRLRDEAPSNVDTHPRPDPDPGLAPQFIIVPGAFNDCFGSETQPFGPAVKELVARGYRIDTIPVSGRSSAERNAHTLAAALRAPPFAGSERIVLLGYSKGAVDVLHLLADFPDIRPRVAAVVSVAGPIAGSRLATIGDWTYDTLLKNALANHCDPGDGGVIDSLRPETRRQWMIDHPLPPHVRFFSVAAFPARELLATALKPAWEELARSDTRNDGQVTLGDALIPGSMLLGYANADHWGVALRVEAVHPHLVARKNQRPFPQAELLEAMVLFVREQLDMNDPATTAEGPG